MRYMFKVINKDTRRTSVLHLFLISDFEKVNAGSVLKWVIINTGTLYQGRNYHTSEIKRKAFKVIIKLSLKWAIYIVYE